MKARSKKNRIFLMVGAGTLILILCFIMILSKMDKTTQLRSDSKGIKFVTEGETVTCVNVRGNFPYNSIVPKLTEKNVTDGGKSAAEVYTIEAEFSLNRQNSMNINIETSNEVVYTYILKFSDKDVTIVNGKVVD